VCKGFWCRSLRKRDYWGDPDVEGDNIKLDLQEVGCGVWTGLCWLRIVTGGGHFECGNEPSGSIKSREFGD
jgi:hypothetical protein